MTSRADDVVVSAGGLVRHLEWRGVCSVGRTGFTRAKREGDGATPIGAFRFEAVYYRLDRIARPITRLPTEPIRLTDGWSDDPSDPNYNRFVRRPHPYRHERLWRADALYDLVIVFDANRSPTIPGCGSALFLHIWRGPRFPTAGCIAMPRADVLRLLRRMSPRTRLVLHAHGDSAGP